MIEEMQHALFPNNACTGSFLHCKFQKTCFVAGPTGNPSCPPHALKALIQQEITKATGESIGSPMEEDMGDMEYNNNNKTGI